MCTINKSAHTKKSGNLFNEPRTYWCRNLSEFLSVIRRPKFNRFHQLPRPKKEKKKITAQKYFLKNQKLSNVTLTKSILNDHAAYKVG